MSTPSEEEARAALDDYMHPTGKTSLAQQASALAAALRSLLASRVSTPPAGEERLAQALRRLLNKHSLHGDVPADDLDDLLDRFDDGAPAEHVPALSDPKEEQNNDR